MPDYKNGKIYKLWSPEGDDIYIGSTVNSLAKRKGEHKRNYNIDMGCSSKILFQKYDDVRIELIEEFPCENKMELNKREGYYIRTLDCVNKVIPDRTQKEWRDNNKEQKKEWYEKNKEKLKEQRKEYVEKNKEKIKEQTKKYRDENKEYYKEWRENNKEKIKEQSKKYYENNYEKNKEKINQRCRERYAMKKSLLSPVLPVAQPPL